MGVYDIDQLETDFFMAKKTSIYSVSNTINKFHIQSYLYLIYKQKLYHDKQYEIDTLFDEYHIHLLNDINHPALIEGWKKNYAAAYDKK